MDDKQLDLRTRIAEAVVPLATLLEEVMGTVPQATVDPLEDRVLRDLIDYEKLGERLTLDYGRLAEHVCLDGVADTVAGNLDMYDLAQGIDMYDLAQNIEASDVAEAIEVDPEDVAAHVDLHGLAGHLDLDGYLPSVEEFVAEVMSSDAYVELVAGAVAAHVVKRLMPQPEPVIERLMPQTETDEQKPVNLSYPVADSDNNTGN